MHVLTTTRAAPVALHHLAAALRSAARAVAAFAARLDHWLVERQRRARDLATLGQMSDRELADIGIGRGYLQDVAAGGWIRDGQALPGEVNR